MYAHRILVQLATTNLNLVCFSITIFLKEDMENVLIFILNLETLKENEQLFRSSEIIKWPLMQKSNVSVWNKDVPGIAFPPPCFMENKGSIVWAFYSLYWG